MFSNIFGLGLIMDNFSLSMTLWNEWLSIPAVREANAAEHDATYREYKDFAIIISRFAFYLATDLKYCLNDKEEIQ